MIENTIWKLVHGNEKLPKYFGARCLCAQTVELWFSFDKVILNFYLMFWGKVNKQLSFRLPREIIKKGKKKSMLILSFWIKGAIPNKPLLNIFKNLTQYYILKFTLLPWSFCRVRWVMKYSVIPKLERLEFLKRQAKFLSSRSHSRFTIIIPTLLLFFFFFFEISILDNDIDQFKSVMIPVPFEHRFTNFCNIFRLNSTS